MHRLVPILSAVLGGAAHAEDVPSAESAGMGGAAVAAPRDNASVTINPAAIALVARYDFQGMFLAGPDGALRWNATAVDGRTSEHITFGLGYHGGLLQRPFLQAELPGWAPTGEELINDYQRHDITFALAVPILERRLSFGVNGTLSIRQGEYIRTGVTGNLDVALAARPIEEFSVGLVGSNLLPVADQPDQPASVALGLRGGTEDLVVGAVDVGFKAEDVTSPWWVAAGIQGSIKFARLRAGWDWDGERGTHRIGWGLGLQAPLGSLSYAMQVPIVTEDFQAASMTHTITLTLQTRIGDKQSERETPQWSSPTR